MRTDRRIAGLLVLICAAALALIVPRVLDPGESGFGIRGPLPAPPAAGSCLDDATGSGPPNWELGELRVVSCDQPHAFEVARSWALDDPLQLPTPGLPAEFEADDCLAAVNRYIGADLDFSYGPWFRPLINPTAKLLPAPVSEQVNGRGWTACITGAPDAARYIGRVGGLTRPGDRPSAFGLCRLETVAINCLQPHDEEVFGLISGFETLDLRPGAVVADQLPAAILLQSQCEAMVADLLQRSVSEWTPVLLHLEVTRDGQQLSRPDDTGVAVQGYLNDVECSMRVATGQLLSDSLVGVGTGPLPLQ